MQEGSAQSTHLPQALQEAVGCISVKYNALAEGQGKVALCPGRLCPRRCPQHHNIIVCSAACQLEAAISKSAQRQGKACRESVTAHSTEHPRTPNAPFRNRNSASMTVDGSSTSVAAPPAVPNVRRTYSAPSPVVCRSASTPSNGCASLPCTRSGFSGGGLPADGACMKVKIEQEHYRTGSLLCQSALPEQLQGKICFWVQVI